MALTKEERQKLDEVHDKVTTIVERLGNGDAGLCHDVRLAKVRIWRLEIIMALLIGSGVISGGVVAIIKCLA